MKTIGKVKKYECHISLPKLVLKKQKKKKPVQFWNNILCTDETKINLHKENGMRRVWKREWTVHDLQKQPKVFI